MKIQYFNKGVINLFDSQVDNLCKGQLIISNVAYPSAYVRMHRYLATLCLVIAFVCMVILFGPLIFFEMQSWVVKAALPSKVAESKVLENSPTLPIVNKDYILSVNSVEDFKIFIPKINVDSVVIANVDSNSEKEYKEKLKKGVAHAKGSYLPEDNKGPIYLFSHSTDFLWNIEFYNAKFYAVKDLGLGDEIILNYKNKDYIYKITDRKITSPGDLDAIWTSSAHLILQTCYPPGTDWNRLLVYADRVN